MNAGHSDGGAASVRLTVAQATVEFLAAQWSERDGRAAEAVRRLLRDLRARQRGRRRAGAAAARDPGAGRRDAARACPTCWPATSRPWCTPRSPSPGSGTGSQTWVCTASVGPGSTNMVTGAALATINRLPVLLLASDTFATRRSAPVLQELEAPYGRGRDRQRRLPAGVALLRPGRARRAAALRPALGDAGADRPGGDRRGHARRCRRTCRPRPTTGRSSCSRSAPGTSPGRRPRRARIADGCRAGPRRPRRPMIVAGGGRALLRRRGGAARAVRGHRDPGGRDARPARARCRTGTRRRWAPSARPGRPPPTPGPRGRRGDRGRHPLERLHHRVADRLRRSRACGSSTSTSPASTPGKQSGLSVVADAREALAALTEALAGYVGRRRLPRPSRPGCGRSGTRGSRRRTTRRRRSPTRLAPGLLTQGTVLGLVNEVSDPRDVVLCAAGSMPGDLHKLWRVRDRKGYHVEYGYSCMGYEVPASLGIRLADETRDVFAMVGDGGYLMMPTELVTAVQERIKVIVVLVQNHGFHSIGSLSEELGSQRFGTSYRYRDGESGRLDGDVLPVDLAANARSLGVHVIEVTSRGELEKAIRHGQGGARRRRTRGDPRARPTRWSTPPTARHGGTCRSARSPTWSPRASLRRATSTTEPASRPTCTPTDHAPKENDEQARPDRHRSRQLGRVVPGRPAADALGAVPRRGSRSRIHPHRARARTATSRPTRSGCADELAQRGLTMTAGTIFEHLHRPDSWDSTWADVSAAASLDRGDGRQAPRGDPGLLARPAVRRGDRGCRADRGGVAPLRRADEPARARHPGGVRPADPVPPARRHPRGHARQRRALPRESPTPTWSRCAWTPVTSPTARATT